MYRVAGDYSWRPAEFFINCIKTVYHNESLQFFSMVLRRRSFEIDGSLLFISVLTDVVLILSICIYVYSG